MQTILDSVDRPAHDAFIEKKSEFIGDACHIESLDDALAFVQTIRDLHPKARHVAYAAVCGGSGGRLAERMSDDGEPSGTAGKPILDVLDTTLTTEVDGERRSIEDVNRDILKGFYSVFKAADADLQFVLLTGVTKFSQVSVFSGFNQPADISLDRRYEALCGITEEELYEVFDEPIKKLQCDTSTRKRR